jgi:uncharacterized protein (DUF433 family)
LYAGEKVDGEVVSVGFVPEDKGTVAYLQVNSSPCRRFPPDAVPRLRPESWRGYSGRYTGVETVAVRAEGDGLGLYSEEVDKWMRLVPLSNTRFACDVGLIEFQVAEDGSVPALRFAEVYRLEKVASQRQSLDDPAFPQVTYRRGAAGQPVPVLRGTGIRVQTVVVAAQQWGMEPGQIASEYARPETQVKEAMGFYAAHPAEIDAALAAEQALEAGPGCA